MISIYSKPLSLWCKPIQYTLSTVTACVLLGYVLSGCHGNRLAPKNINLEGAWLTILDSLNVGENENWAAQPLKGIPINLPGTLDDAQLGKPNGLVPALNNAVLSNLARKHQFIGKAWYQREVEIPDNWQGKQVTLHLERVMWKSTVYIDGQKVGSAQSLVGSHDFDLSQWTTPGKHLLTVMVDNGNQHPNINVQGNRYPDPVNQDMAHGYTNHTQIKWNGMLGKLQLQARSLTRAQNLQVYPNTEKGKLRFSANLPNAEGWQLALTGLQGKMYYQGTPTITMGADNVGKFEINAPDGLAYWDEFTPQLYTAHLVNGPDTLSATFGYRQVQADRGVLKLNGQRIFLRGNLECAIFPLTGYPPMDKAAWLKLIGQAKNYGLNHLRFHSWCPPKAAFEAADETGFYLQVELPHWSLEVGEDAKTVAFLKNEAQKMLQDYGNHPSFILMSLGNELQGDIALLNEMLAPLKAQDARHLYATTTFSFQKPTGTVPEPADEFFVTQWTDKGWIRGQGIFNAKAPHFNKDYTANSAHIGLPLISHEIGQYAVYPDMREIDKYTGVLSPLNFIAVQQALDNKGMASLAESYTLASGKLAAMLYKEEIERALKTPGFDGFQLLQLQDFPGQGTALVGLLNAFWETKGAISAKEFRKFNSPVVPLLRFDKAAYESGETFRATIEVANFYKAMPNQTIEWSIVGEGGQTAAEGELNQVDLLVGNNVNLGEIAWPLAFDEAKRLNISLRIQGTDFQNDWPIWIYPKKQQPVPEGVIVTQSFTQAAQALASGAKVLLTPPINQLKGVEGRFVPVFWSPVHFPDQPGTMGLLIDHKHQALAQFPTRNYSEWQWWDLCIQSKPVITDGLGIDPIVRTIDNFVTNRHLASIFEAKVGEGSLLFSAIDLHSDLGNRPEARQLRNSILEYMGSPNFAPKQTLTKAALMKLKQ